MVELKGKDFYEDAFELIKSGEEEKREVLEALMVKYNLSQEAIYWRIRTYWGDKLKNLRWNFFEPSREEFIRNLLLANDTHDLRQMYSKMSNKQWVGIFDRIMGVSTFTQAKLKALQEIKIKQYNPSTRDNIALFAAVIIGDAYVDLKRYALRIEHSAKQKCWLETKVQLLKQAFPYMSTKITKRARGTYAWYSRTIPSKKYRDLMAKSRAELVSKLNAFGLWLLFLDDGNLFDDGKTCSLSYSGMPDVMDALNLKLQEYGFKFHRYSDKALTITSSIEIQRFLNEIILPFEYLTPYCMHYKLHLKR